MWVEPESHGNPEPITEWEDGGGYEGHINPQLYLGVDVNSTQITLLSGKGRFPEGRFW